MKCVRQSTFTLTLKKNPGSLALPQSFGNIIHSVLEDNVSDTVPLELDRS